MSKQVYPNQFYLNDSSSANTPVVVPSTIGPAAQQANTLAFRVIGERTYYDEEPGIVFLMGNCRETAVGREKPTMVKSEPLITDRTIQAVSLIATTLTGSQGFPDLWKTVQKLKTQVEQAIAREVDLEKIAIQAKTPSEQEEANRYINRKKDQNAALQRFTAIIESASISYALRNYRTNSLNQCGMDIMAGYLKKDKVPAYNTWLSQVDLQSLHGIVCPEVLRDMGIDQYLLRRQQETPNVASHQGSPPQ